MDKLSFICFSLNNWEKRKARKQQFMLHFSLRKDTGPVLYIEPALNLSRLFLFPFRELKSLDSRQRWSRALSFKIEHLPEASKLFIFTPIFLLPFSFRFQFIYNLNLFPASLIIKLRIKRLNFKDRVLWLYHPLDYKLLKWFKNRRLAIFDWAEDWAEYFTEFSPPRRKFISSLEEKIIRRVDIVFVVSRRLFERAKKINAHSYQILDGTTPQPFSEYAGRLPQELSNIPHPILGYLGTVYKRLDLDLMLQLSESLPQCSIVLVGNILYSPEQVARIKDNKNVFLLGAKSYAELPDYLMNFDVCLLPYIPLPDTSPPTKIYDYLATGKPIVSTYLSELKNFSNLIKLARSNEEFISFVSEALNEDDVRLRNERFKKAQENSWFLRTEEITGIISKDNLNIR